MFRIRSMSRDLAHLSDEAIVALAARSDETALAELYDRFGRAAYGLAFRVLRDASLAEDAVQEAFLDVWRRRDRFVPERAGAARWIFTFVHRRAVDVVRREERRRTEQLDEAAGAGRGAADDAVWLRLERERVQDALGQLPDAQREAIELAYYGGFTQSELAERLGEPLGTIKSRMFAGLARLRELLERRHMGTTTLHDLTAAYALDALDARRAGRVRGATSRAASAAGRSSGACSRSRPRSPTRPSRAGACRGAAGADPRGGAGGAAERRAAAPAPVRCRSPPPPPSPPGRDRHRRLVGFRSRTT